MKSTYKISVGMLSLLLCAALSAWPRYASAQAAAAPPASPPASPEKPGPLDQANAALAAGDYELALKLLTPLAAAHPGDVHILYDLAAAHDALDQVSAAEPGYRAAIAADPAFLPPHVALGLLLARNNRFAEARTELLAATALHDNDNLLTSRAYRALARIDQRERPADSRDELLAALKLTPETPDDALLAAELAAAPDQGAGAAEAAYRKVLAARPSDPAATAELAHLLTGEKRAVEAETLLTDALAAYPGDAALSAQLATIYAGEGKFDLAIPLVGPLYAANPRDPNIAHLLSGLYLQNRDYAAAEPILAALSTQYPEETSLVDDRARALIHLKRNTEAEEILTRIVAQPKLFPTPLDLADAAGDLAFAASANNQPEEALHALEVRATVQPPSAPMLFLAAISHDKLHQVKLAIEAYQKFLEASKGANPDEEFEARHRLIALEHMK